MNKQIQLYGRTSSNCMLTTHYASALSHYVNTLTMTLSKLTRSRYGFNGRIFVGRCVFTARKPDGFKCAAVDGGATIVSHAPLFTRSKRAFS